MPEIATQEDPDIRWLTVAGTAALFVAVGMGRFAYPPMIPALVRQGWFTAASADYLGAANLAGFAAGAIFANTLARRVPIPWVFRTCMTAVGFSYLACMFPLGFFWFFIWRLLAGVTGAVLMVFAAPTILVRVPPRHRGWAGGVIFMGAGLGTVVSGMAVPVLVKWGLPKANLGLGMLCLGVTAPFWNLWPKGVQEQPVVAETRNQPPKSWMRPALGLLAAVYATNAIGFVAHTVFWVDYIARGLDRGLTTAGRYWMLFGFSTALGPILAGLMADRIGFRKSMRWALLAESVGVVLPVFYNAPVVLAVSSVCVGGMALGIVSLASGRVGEMVAVGEQKKYWGQMTAIFALAYAAAAYLMSWLFSMTGSYHLLFGIGAATLLTGCVLDYFSSLRSASQ